MKKKFPKFYEYLDQKGTLVEKPKEEEVPDYHGKTPTSPPKSITKGKKWDAETAKPIDAVKPYKAPGKDMTLDNSMKNLKDGEGLGAKGDKRLSYKPKLKAGTSKNMTGGKEINGWEKKTKTEQFIDKTKNMSFGEFTEYMKEHIGAGDDDDLPTVTSYVAGKFHPHPPEVINYITALSGKNGRVLEQLVHEIKKKGLLTQLVKAMMEHPETADVLTDLLNDDKDGPKHCRSLARSMDKNYQGFIRQHADMFESVGPPFGGDDEDPSPEEGEGQAGDLEDQPGGEDQPPEEGGEDQPDGEEDQPPEEGGEDQPDGEEDQPPEEGEPEDEEGAGEPPPPQKKPKKKFAHNHMLDALSNFEHMRSAMKAY